jgi:hypothetical protein
MRFEIAISPKLNQPVFENERLREKITKANHKATTFT